MRNGLVNRRVLIVEDELLLADDIAESLREVGATVIGPVPGRGEELSLVGDLLSSGEKIDVAILDFGLQGKTVLPLVDVLQNHGVPFVFATGLNREMVPPEYRGVPLWEKPFDAIELAGALPSLIQDT